MSAKGQKRTSEVGYSITSSARAIRVGATATPSALAVLRLITSSNVVGCMTGRSAAFAPFQYFAGVAADLAVCVHKTNAITYQAAAHDIFSKFVHCRNSKARCQRYEQLAMREEKRIRRHQ